MSDKIINFRAGKRRHRSILGKLDQRRQVSMVAIHSIPRKRQSLPIQVPFNQINIGTEHRSYDISHSPTSSTDCAGGICSCIIFLTVSVRFGRFIAHAQGRKDHVPSSTVRYDTYRRFPFWSLSLFDQAESKHDTWRFWSKFDTG